MNVDYLQTLGISALGSRIRRIFEHLNGAVTAVYRQHGVDFEPGWSPLFRLIADQGPIGIADAASRVGVAHPTAIAVANALEARGLIQVGRDERDARRRLLSLSSDGQALLTRLQPLWHQVDEAAEQLGRDAGVDLVNWLERVEDALKSEPHAQRLAKREHFL